MKFTMDMLKKVTENETYSCLWCREVIKDAEEHYKRRRHHGLIHRYHLHCIHDSIKRNQFDGLMFKEG